MFHSFFLLLTFQVWALNSWSVNVPFVLPVRMLHTLKLIKNVNFFEIRCCSLLYCIRQESKVVVFLWSCSLLCCLFGFFVRDCHLKLVFLLQFSSVFSFLCIMFFIAEYFFSVLLIYLPIWNNCKSISLTVCPGNNF